MFSHLQVFFLLFLGNFALLLFRDIVAMRKACKLQLFTPAARTTTTTVNVNKMIEAKV